MFTKDELEIIFSWFCVVVCERSYDEYDEKVAEKVRNLILESK